MPSRGPVVTIASNSPSEQRLSRGHLHRVVRGGDGGQGCATRAVCPVTVGAGATAQQGRDLAVSRQVVPVRV